MMGNMFRRSVLKTAQRYRENSEKLAREFDKPWVLGDLKVGKRKLPLRPCQPKDLAGKPCSA